jgi:hypothetical protein
MDMRIERTWQVKRLTPRLERFFVEALGGQALDDIQQATVRKVDYKCLDGLLAIELKSLGQCTFRCYSEACRRSRNC